MLVREHPEARCPWCGKTLWYGLKEEATGWKVQYSCLAQEGCGRELSPGRVSRSDVDTDDQAHERAEALGRRLY